MNPIHKVEFCDEYWELHDKYVDAFQEQYTAKELNGAYYEMRAHWYMCDKCKVVNND